MCNSTYISSSVSEMSSVLIRLSLLALYQYKTRIDYYLVQHSIDIRFIFTIGSLGRD